MYDIAEKIDTKVLKQGDSVIKQNEVNDNLIISLKGKLGEFKQAIDSSGHLADD